MNRTDLSRDVRTNQELKAKLQSNQTMKFEIKKFQSMRTNDGGGFSFDLYMDGVKAAFVCDEGNGGCLFVQWSDRKQGVSELEKKFDEYVKALPPEKVPDTAEAWEKEMYPTGFRTLDGDMFFYTMVDAYENAKRLRRMCAKKTLFRLPEDGTEFYRTINRPFSPEVKAHIMQKYPTAAILNESL